MKEPKKVTLNNVEIKLDFSLNCMTENCIYVALCTICDCEFYLGKTVNMARTRFNGHRGCFKLKNSKYSDSALSMHIFEAHIEKFGDKLKNFKMGIVKEVKPTSLNRMEDYYIYVTKADTISLI